MGLENSVSQKFHAQKLNRIFKEETYEFKAPSQRLISLIPEEGFALPPCSVQLALPAETNSLWLLYEDPEVNKKVTSSPVLLCPPLPEIDFKNVNVQRQDEENLEKSRNVAETVSSFQTEIAACEKHSELSSDGLIEQLAISPDQCLDNEGQQSVNYNPLLCILSETRKQLGFSNLPSEDLLLSSELNIAFKKLDSDGLSLQSQKTKSNSLSFTQVKTSVRAINSSMGNELSVYFPLPASEKAESLSQFSKQKGTEDGTKFAYFDTQFPAPVQVKANRGIADFFPVNLAGLILSFHDDGG